jgi:hypothetical protein
VAENNTDSTPKKEKKEPKWWPAFLDALSRTGNVFLSSKQARISRRQVYTCRERSEKFRKLWDDALEDAADLLEGEARRRAFGVDKPIYYKGKKVDVIKEYSDTLVIFLLKAIRPEKFRDNYDLRRLIEEYTAVRSGDGEPLPGDPKSR